MSWILVLSLFSNPAGNYVREFSNEGECRQELTKFVQKNQENTDVKYVGCISTSVAFNEEEEE